MTPLTPRYPNLHTLSPLLAAAERGGYAVGSFSPRYTPVIPAIFRAGNRLSSPLIVQISQIEFKRSGIGVGEFAEAFFSTWAKEQPAVPVCLHLDHTQSFDVIQAAITGGFTSVMFDASAKPLEENIAITQEVVAYAHAHNVSVEAELGRIGTADFMETETDEELFTDPVEAERFVQETGVDALAVSVGTAHGVYTIRQPRIDLLRLRAIRARTGVHLVLHGGSGTPAGMIYEAIHLPGGGISKINIATDLEQAFLAALKTERMPNTVLKSFSDEELHPGLEAVQAVVEEKITRYLGSDGRA